eukprot:TRINITY_DN2012_c0_g1_i4.p1 TRINITY_DN2012_c0_g1~~TRINITY_DN2012_c0_g1_i4.p1  ORF type:complete len:465 (-),score=71.52 TRINITY_DN2012_c0_g1_i4:81-1475(-)
MIALPADVKRLAPERASSATGAIAACGSAAQVLGLMAVYYSDTCTFRYGRRRPFLVLGALLTVLGGCAWIVGSAVELLAFVALGYVIMFVGVAIGNSIIPTLFTDLLPQSQHGMANGIMGLENLIGSALGFGLFGVGVDTWVCLIIFVAISAVLLLPTLIFSHETQYMPPPRPKESHSHWTACKDGCTSFAFSWREHPDFVLVLLVRVLYYVCTGAATYMQYWAGDVLQTDNAEQVVGQLGVVTLITAVLIAVPTGALSDRFGRRPFAACGLLFLAAGVCSWAAVQSLPGVWISVCIFGLGNGLYPSVETAQACDCLPSNRDSGRFLGEFALAATLGQLVGQFGVGVQINGAVTTNNATHEQACCCSSLPSHTAQAALLRRPPCRLSQAVGRTRRCTSTQATWRRSSRVACCALSAVCWRSSSTRCVERQHRCGATRCKTIGWRCAVSTPTQLRRKWVRWIKTK